MMYVYVEQWFLIISCHAPALRTEMFSRSSTQHPHKLKYNWEL